MIINYKLFNAYGFGVICQVTLRIHCGLRFNEEISLNREDFVASAMQFANVQRLCFFTLSYRNISYL